MRKKTSIVIALLIFLTSVSYLKATETFVHFTSKNTGLALVTPQIRSFAIWCDEREHKGVLTAVHNLQTDFGKVTNITPDLTNEKKQDIRIIIGSFDKSPLIRQLVRAGKLDAKELKNKNEKFIITTLHAPLEDLDGEVLLIAGSDKRGTIYGIYELSRQIGVSPWYWWADVPIRKQQNVYVKPGQYTDGEPAVTYRGIFLNDEAPCLTG